MSHKCTLFGFDFIRGCAAVWIAFYHYTNIFGDIAYLGKWGRVLVEIFFILSGFLFYHAYFERINSDSYPLSCFIADRFWRLMPLMMVANAIAVLIYYLCLINSGLPFNHGRPGFTLSGMIVGCLGVPVWSPLFEDNPMFANSPQWYVIVLLFNYLILYGIVYYFRNLRLQLCCFAFMIFVGLVLMVNDFGGIHIAFFERGFARGYIGCSLGCLLCIAYKRGIIKEIFLFLFPFSLLTVLCIYLLGERVIGDLNLFVLFVVGPTLFAFVLLNQGLCKIFFENFVFRFLGRISYSVYLWNIPVIIFFIFKPISHTGEAKGVVLFSVVLFVISSLSYLYLEKKIIPFLKRKF